MKKGTSFLTVISIICITFCACKLSLEDTDLFDRPEVSTADNQISVFIPRLNNTTKYINVFRQEGTSTPVIIGIINQNALMDKNYLFIDELAQKQHKYKYRVRYCDDSGYHYSKWSETISTKNGEFAHDESKKMKYDASSVRFKYNKDEYTLTIDGTITAPNFTGFFDDAMADADDSDDLLKEFAYKPMIVISDSEKTEAIQITSTADETVIPLRNILPLYFLDTNISIKGIIAKQNKYKDNDVEEDDLVIKYIKLLELEEVNVTGAGSSKILNIPSQIGDAGLDYNPSI